MTGDLSPSVQMQYMRPGQLESALQAFPVVYVPFGPIEWHGRHLPLGTDALKAHGVLVKTAEFLGVTGKLQVQDGVVHLIAEDFWLPKLDLRPPSAGSRDFH